MRSFDIREPLEINLERQIASVRTSDSKVVLLIPTSGIMIGVLAALLRTSNATGTMLYIVAACVVPIFIAYVFIALTLVPRVGAPGNSLLYFGSIAEHDREDYQSKAVSMSHEVYLNDLADQCYVVSRIARTKYRHVRRAYVAFFVALPFWSVAVYNLTPTLGR